MIDYTKSNKYVFFAEKMVHGMLKDCYSITESNGQSAVTITMHGPVDRDRELAERRIARHRLEQLSYVHVRVERKAPRRDEYEY